MALHPHYETLLIIRGNKLLAQSYAKWEKNPPKLHTVWFYLHKVFWSDKNGSYGEQISGCQGLRTEWVGKMGLALSEPCSEYCVSQLHQCQYPGCNALLQFFQMMPWEKLDKRLKLVQGISVLLIRNIHQPTNVSKLVCFTVQRWNRVHIYLKPGCYNKIPKTRWIRWQKFISHSSSD